MAGKKRNSSFEILTAMQDLNTPAGALQLAQILHLPSASIGRELLELEKTGLLVKVQNKGRIGNSWRDMRRRHVQSGLSRRNFRN